LLIHPNGGKYWQLAYRYGASRNGDGKAQKVLSLGTYPDITLSEARERRAQARKLIANGTDPAEIKRIDKQQRKTLSENSFEVVARDWFERHLSKRAESTKEKITSRMERFVLPYIGKRPIAEISTLDILELLQRVETLNSTDTAHRVKQEIGQIIRFAIQTGRAVNDPIPALRGVLPPIVKTHFASPAEDPAKVAVQHKYISHL
jgi:hypothetical protein